MRNLPLTPTPTGIYRQPPAQLPSPQEFAQEPREEGARPMGKHEAEKYETGRKNKRKSKGKWNSKRKE
jgi:hypothetical protein